MRIKLFVFSLIISQVVFCQEMIKLTGTWAFEIDAENVGVNEKWYQRKLKDNIELPGTTDTNRKGALNSAVELNHLTRKYIFEGKAWYQKQFTLPPNWVNKDVELFIERTKATKVWINNKFVGGSKLLSAPQVFNITNYLSNGSNTISICVDNSSDLFPTGGSHALAEHTQTNWNGMIGELKITAKSPVHYKLISNEVDLKRGIVSFKFLSNNPNGVSLKSKFVCSGFGINANTHNIGKQSIISTSKLNKDTVVFNYKLGRDFKLWSHINPNLYNFKIEIVNLLNPLLSQEIEQTIGLREFAIEGRHFYVNGNKTFIISKHDACIFPLTGFPPMTKEEWIRQMKISKQYGINSYRFHSWTPPKACFEAADIVGIYLQPELPAWTSSNKDGLKDDKYYFLLNEGIEIFNAFGKHTSFVKFSLGNELSGSRDLWSDMILELKQLKTSIFISQGSNNFFWDPKVDSNEDFFITAKVGPYKPNFESDIRASFAFVDDPNGGGVLNRMTPNSNFTFSEALKDFQLPVLSHETGQYQSLPNYNEIPKYTGVLEPRNLITFKNKMKQNGMFHYWEELYKASGYLSSICYRADNEIMLRTPELAGFQILDLQDFPGQGTALVGVLDAFMDSKGFISAEQWRQSCNDLTIQAALPKYVWSNNENFAANIRIINYDHSNYFSPAISWEIVDADNKVFFEGKFKNVNAVKGQITEIETINADFRKIDKATALRLIIKSSDNRLKNDYSIWVYPEVKGQQVSTNFSVTNFLSNEVLDKLNNGEKVLLLPDSLSIKSNSVGGLFTSDYWCYPMFKGISVRAKKPVSPGTLGLLIDDTHPVFRSFPTGKYTDWQWFSVIKRSRPIFIDATSINYRPIVHVVDNFERSSKLGLMFEFKVGKGKLFICSVDFKNSKDLVLNNLYKSLIDYIESTSFNPTENISAEELMNIIYGSKRLDGVRQTSAAENTDGYLMN